MTETDRELWTLQGQVAALEFLVRRMIAERCAATADPAAENARWLAMLDHFRRYNTVAANVPHQDGKVLIEATEAAGAAEQLIERLTRDPEARY